MPSPLEAALRSRNAVLVKEGGVMTAGRYGDPLTEARRARRSVGLVDVTPSVILRVRGEDRVSYLHRILSCEVKGLAVGEAARGLLLTAKGKVVTDLFLAVLRDRVSLVAPPGARPALAEGLGKFIVGDDVTLEDRDGKSGALSFVGPRAAEAAGLLFGGTLPECPDPGAADGSAGDRRVTIFRRTRAGLPAVDLSVDAAAAPALFEAALQAVGSLDGGLLGSEGLDLLRVENGVPRLGAEFGEDTLPQEAGLEGFVSFTKGCFLGQEPVARLQNRGHTNRGLAGLSLEGGAPLPARGDPVLDGDREAGAVTSACVAPTLGKPVALAVLRHESAKPGTRLTVRSGDAGIGAEVTGLPFVQ